MSPSGALEAARPGERGLAGLVEGSWSGLPGTVAWTAALAPAAWAYAAVSGAARRRAAASRRGVPGVAVIAVGNLTVGGTGKSSLAQWLASRAPRAAIVLRGHGGRIAGEAPAAVPDFAGYPLARAAERYGDEAAAHRAALPIGVAVVAGRDRRRGAILARDGYGASTVVLDDGWEQPGLAWDELWVALDPVRPAGNGWLLPAGPLRRPPETLREADVLAFVLESAGDVPPRTLDWARVAAPRARLRRFRRTLRGISPIGARAVYDPAASGSGAQDAAPGPAVGPAALITGVGAPERVLRLAAAEGIRVVDHAPFADHARVAPDRLMRVLERAARRGAEVALITEKDEHRWTMPADAPLPVRVLRTALVPLDPVEPLPREAGEAVSAAPSHG